MLKRIIGLASSSSNIYKVINDNSNYYKSMIIDAMRINYDYSSKCLCFNEEPNIDATKVFTF
jgi:hypothetical protein